MRLATRHLQELREGSGIPDELIAEGGVRTISTRAEVAEVYTEWWQQLTPAIAFPVHPPDGSNGLYVIKPDRPRRRKDKPDKFVKYEWPHGQPHRLDVVGDLADLADPSVDLYVIEGWKKAAKLLAEMRARGRRCVIIVVWGVWAWGKKPDERSRPSLLADWDLIALDGRRVFIVFDSDRNEKESVELAARWLADRLAERGAEVYHVNLPSEPDGSKNGADDLIVRHGFEAFEDCVEAAIDHGPHGTEALRAAWRRQREELRALRMQLSAEAKLRAVPEKKMDHSTKAVLLATTYEIAGRASHSDASEKRFDVTDMARRTGLSNAAFSRKLKQFPDLFEVKYGKFDPSNPMDKRTAMYVHQVDPTLKPTEVVSAAISGVGGVDRNWGGPRAPKQIGACTDHPDSNEAVRISQVVCGEPVDDERICGLPLSEPNSRRIERTTFHLESSCDEARAQTTSQLVISLPDTREQSSLAPLDVRIAGQDATSSEPSHWPVYDRVLCRACGGGLNALEQGAGFGLHLDCTMPFESSA